MNAPTLTPLPRGQRKMDAGHLNLPVFHFVGAGLAVC
jgi:hypothetical protein